MKQSLGPTPQRDGKVLGIFDALSSRETPDSRGTKRKSFNSRVMEALTPSKKPRRESIEAAAVSDHESFTGYETGRLERTPASSGKRYLLSTYFSTPRRPKATAEKELQVTATPTRKLDFMAASTSTPSFLRRDSQRYNSITQSQNSADAPPDEDVSFSPVAVRMPPKFTGRGLSALVKGLRNMENERFADEEDALRELEMEADAEAAIERVGSPTAARGEESTRSPEDYRQAPDMPLGPDKGIESTDEEEVDEARNRPPRRVWKKKGQKRTTRRVIMRPVREKAKNEPQCKGPEEEESLDELGAADTQVSSGRIEDRPLQDDRAGHGLEHNDGNPEMTGSDAGTHPEPGTGSTGGKTAGKHAVATAKVSANAKKPAAARKSKPDAHANYRALKIKNRNSKAKGRGRFGRR